MPIARKSWLWTGAIALEKIVTTELSVHLLLGYKLLPYTPQILLS